jgi:hypothetical protein
MKLLFVLGIATGAWAQTSCPQWTWSVDTLRMGSIEQGELAQKEVKLQVNQNWQTDSVIAQGAGVTVLGLPKEMRAQKAYTLKVAMNTQDRVGGIREHLTVVAGQCYATLALDGEVRPAVLFDPPMANLGLLGANAQREIQVYAWDPRGKALDLQAQSDSTWWVLSQKPVQLEFVDGTVQEVAQGKPGLKLQLQITPPVSKRASVGVFMAFQSKSMPKANVEYYAMGWKGDTLPGAQKKP